MGGFGQNIRETVLIGNVSGKRYNFVSIKDACDFLGRSYSYVGEKVKTNSAIWDRDRTETFEVLIAPKKRENYTMRMQPSKQLCWSCGKACGGCSWSKSGKPVEGWEAEESLIRNANQSTVSYKIMKCPEYVSD